MSESRRVRCIGDCTNAYRPKAVRGMSVAITVEIRSHTEYSITALGRGKTFSSYKYRVSMRERCPACGRSLAKVHQYRHSRCSTSRATTQNNDPGRRDTSISDKIGVRGERIEQWPRMASFL